MWTMPTVTLFIPITVFLVHTCLVDATIEVYDRFGQEVDSFEDREAPFEDDFDTLDGFLFGSDPPNACSSIAPPGIIFNSTMKSFVLINGSDECLTLTKLRFADRAGYDVAIIYDAYKYPFHFPLAPLPTAGLDIQALFISYEDGIILRDNYLYNYSIYYNYCIRIRPDRPDITYYMYLFGGVIAVCFFVMLLFMMCLLIKCIQERRRLQRHRLTSRQIRQIPTAKFSTGDQYDLCAICLENYNEGDKLRILPCSHAYHSKCIDPWLMNNRRNCPLCKRKIRFGDSDEESGSDSELTSPAENTPLLSSSINHMSSQYPSRYNSMSSANPNQSTNNSPPSLPSSSGTSLLQQPSNLFLNETSSENPFMSDDESETLLPPPHHSVNSRERVPNSTLATAVVRIEAREEPSCQKGLSV